MDWGQVAVTFGAVIVGGIIGSLGSFVGGFLLAKATLRHERLVELEEVAGKSFRLLMDVHAAQKSGQSRPLPELVNAMCRTELLGDLTLDRNKLTLPDRTDVDALGMLNAWEPFLRIADRENKDVQERCFDELFPALGTVERGARSARGHLT